MSTENTLPFASVIICSRNRHELLEKAVSAVHASTYPRDRFEIVVVEECESPDPIDATVYVHLPVKNLGLGYCHNRGVAAAKGEIIVFTDDDALAEPTWLAALLSCFDDPLVYGAAGCVRTQRGSARGETEEILGLPGGGIKTLARSKGSIIPTAHLSTVNLAYRSSIFKEFSFLETSFGKFGGDDWYLGTQVSSRYKTVFNPAAVVHHKPKATFSRLIHTYYRRQLTDYLGKRDLHKQTKFQAIFGKKQHCVIFRMSAAALFTAVFGVPGILFLAAGYYTLSLLSIAPLFPYIRNPQSTLMYPLVKGITELGILKGELLILFAREKQFDTILERY
jgi:glycosyltransferase involved in cell wall biosynthesis